MEGHVMTEGGLTPGSAAHTGGQSQGTESHAHAKVCSPSHHFHGLYNDYVLHGWGSYSAVAQLAMSEEGQWHYWALQAGTKPDMSGLVEVVNELVGPQGAEVFAASINTLWDHGYRSLRDLMKAKRSSLEKIGIQMRLVDAIEDAQSGTSG